MAGAGSGWESPRDIDGARVIERIGGPPWWARPAVLGPLVVLLVVAAVAASRLSPAAAPSPPAASPSASAPSSAVAVGTAAVPTVGPPPSPSVSAPRPATATFRVPLPYPDPQTVEPAAVTADAIWILDGGQRHLVRIDLASGRVTSVIATEPGLLAASDDEVWLLAAAGPVAGGTTLWRADPATGRLVAAAFLPPAAGVAAGLGAVWAAGEDGVLRKLDPRTGRVLASPPLRATSVLVACGGLWAYRIAAPSHWQRLDPVTLQVLEDVPAADAPNMAEVAGGCWTMLGTNGGGSGPIDVQLARLEPGHGIVERSPRLDRRVQATADGFWTWTVDGAIQRLDPATGAGVGPVWQLPAQDVATSGVQSPDWRLLTAGGSLWLLNGAELVRYEIPAS